MSGLESEVQAENRDREPIDGAQLRRQFGGRLIEVPSPLDASVADGGSAACAAALDNLRNPYFIEDEPGAYHTTGWHGAFESRHSPYAVAVETAADIAGAVRFARERGVGLAIKGTGHDYQGRSSAPGSLLVWTHAMRDVTVHDAFTPASAPAGHQDGIPAVTVGAGTDGWRSTRRSPGAAATPRGVAARPSAPPAGSRRAVVSEASPGATGPRRATSSRSRS